MNILILGGGGREHALAWKINQSPLCKSLHVAPGNAGTGLIAKNAALDILDFDEVEEYVIDNEIELLVVGPEAPLVAGITDHFNEKRPELMVIGPGKEGAMLEGSKSFAKQFMMDNNIPTAKYLEVTQGNIESGIKYIQNNEGPYVLKADGLAAGKGVLIIEDQKEALNELKSMLQGKFGEASRKVVIEEFLSGIEFSVFILTDGKYYILLPEAKDYKRIGEGDTGLNTGGMGAISPVPFVNKEMVKKVKQRIILPTLSGLQDRDIEYVGFIFFGLISVKGEPYVIEYNCRLGDPETEVVLPRLKNDIVELFEALFEDDLYEIGLEKDTRTAATVMTVSKGYPGKYEKGKAITIKGDHPESLIFHAGTKLAENGVVTSGGRVIAVTSLDNKMPLAVNKSLETIKSIDFEGKYFRHDIGFDL